MITVANISTQLVHELGICAECRHNALYSLSAGYKQTAVDSVRFCQGGHRSGVSTILTAAAPGDHLEVTGAEADALARAAGDAAGLEHEDQLVSLLEKLAPGHPLLETRRRIAAEVAALGIEVRP